MPDLNIFQRMSAITQEISTVAKNLNVGLGKSQYKAVGEADVLAAVKPIEAKHGIYSFPYARDIIDSGEIVSTSTYNGQTNEKKQLFMRVRTIYRFVNVDKPTEYIDITTYGDGVDSQDKAPGKAMTYGDKYALLKAYKIQTGDDPDQNASEPLKGKSTGRQKAEPVEDKTGQPAYPPVEQMVNAITAYAKTHKNAQEFLDKSIQSMKARDIAELAFMNENLIIACYNKWCNR